MTNTQIKKRIAQGTGIPIELLKGDCPGEIVSRARALVLAKRQKNAPAVLTYQQCEQWFQKKAGVEIKGSLMDAMEVLNRIQLEIAAADPIQGARCQATQIFNRENGRCYSVPETLNPRKLECI